MEREVKELKQEQQPIKLINVAAYARVSSGKDTMLHSLATQVNFYKTMIQKNPRYNFIEVYTDEAISGTKNDRDNFLRMVSDAKAGKIDLILTKSISRFARNTITLLNSIRELKSYNVDVYFEEQNIHTISKEGELMLSILASYAQEESRSVSENMKWRIKKDFEEGLLWGSRDHLGYKIIKRKLILIPEEAELVKRIFELYSNGFGYNKIAKILNSEKVAPKYSNKWDQSSIRSIIGNINYTGDLLLQKTYIENYLSKRMMINKGQKEKYLVENDHEPIISKELFNKCLKLRNQKEKQFKVRRFPKHENFFKDLLFCGLCGKKYRFRQTKSNTLYHCSTFLKFGKNNCSSKQISESSLIEAICKVLNTKEFDAEAMKKKISQIKVFPNNELEIIFKDGNSQTILWKDKSRKESWTPEKREMARIKALEYRRKANG